MKTEDIKYSANKKILSSIKVNDKIMFITKNIFIAVILGEEVEVFYLSFVGS